MIELFKRDVYKTIKKVIYIDMTSVYYFLSGEELLRVEKISLVQCCKLLGITVVEISLFN